MENKFFIPVLVAAIIVFAGTYFFQKIPITPTPSPVACTMEAKLCPDGSYVGRTGPRCEFAACGTPAPSEQIWVSDTVSGVQFSYPKTLGISYIHTSDWPPTVTIRPGTFSCDKESRVIDGQPYCVQVTSEGAAGSVYTAYTYTTEKNGKIVSVYFVLRSPQCDNYSEPERITCKNEQQAFSVDSLAHRITSSVK